MRYLIAFLLLLSLTATARDRVYRDHSVVPTDIHCFKLNLLLKELRENFGEEPIFVGKSEQTQKSTTMMFVNQETGSYTVIGVKKEMGCILDTGGEVRYRMPKSLENRIM